MFFLEVQIIKPEQQAVGYFDGGKITEQKPIGFSGEGSFINRLGPLFYWAWAKSDGEAGIGFHPHKGFEILSYNIEGSMRHQDTLGTISEIGAGGVQVMQTGSGVQHAESLLEPSEGFQIWFEPYLTEAGKRNPTYSKYVHEDFPSNSIDGVTVKTILGDQSPINLVTDAQMSDVEIIKGASYSYVLSPNRTFAALAIRGNGGIISERHAFENKDFMIIQADKTETIFIKPEESDLRLVWIELPTEVDYPLYRKPR
jgi:redox-sensitive bicupin YhaK (pirin superfamily)